MKLVKGWNDLLKNTNKKLENGRIWCCKTLGSIIPASLFWTFQRTGWKNDGLFSSLIPSAAEKSQVDGSFCKGKGGSIHPFRESGTLSQLGNLEKNFIKTSSWRAPVSPYEYRMNEDVCCSGLFGWKNASSYHLESSYKLETKTNPAMCCSYVYILHTFGSEVHVPLKSPSPREIRSCSS